MILLCACCTEARETQARIVSIHCHFQGSGHWVSSAKSRSNSPVQVVIYTFTCDTHVHPFVCPFSACV